jgi:hypothetical protein
MTAVPGGRKSARVCFRRAAAPFRACNPLTGHRYSEFHLLQALHFYGPLHKNLPERNTLRTFRARQRAIIPRAAFTKTLQIKMVISSEKGFSRTSGDA